MVDIGASLGATVVKFAQKARKIYAFEPHPENYQFLCDQIHIRNLSNVKTYQKAASDFNGSAQFYNRESHGIHSLGVHNKGKILSSFKVEVIKLDDFWHAHINAQIGLLKIDVEGFEADVLQGATYLLENQRIDAIIFEFSPRIHQLRKIDIFAPINILLKYGYQISTIDGQKFEMNENKLPKICDLIALKPF